MKLRQNKRNQGITLVALAVTIIILIILATISIRMVIGEGGLIYQANNAKLEYRGATVDEEVLAWKAEKEMAKYDGSEVKTRESLINDQLSRELLTADEANIAKKVGQVQIGSRLINYGEPTTIKEAKENQYQFESTTTVADEKENDIVIPGKFHIAEDSGDTVQDGIVIEDSDGNQFVWIPVSNVDGDNITEGNEENLITLNNGTQVEITLGRYTFDESNGNPTLVQRGSEYKEEKIINNTYADFIENSIFREASGDGNSIDEFNATTKDLGSFIASVQRNHGYYFGRYEASYGSGTEFGVLTAENKEEGKDFYKPLIQKSKQNSEDEWTPPTSNETVEETKGKLWNYITQGNASKASRNMYNIEDEESRYVESDLVNSYMWDTAIVYIQVMENSNYANQTDGNGTLRNSGETSDEQCKIFDMAGNVWEWTTESSTYIDDTIGNSSKPSVYRGGNYLYAIEITTLRNFHAVIDKYQNSGFRLSLYIK